MQSIRSFKMVVCVSLVVIFIFCAHQATVAKSYDIALLQALDKVTARVSQVKARVGRRVRFGTLEIVVRSCDKRPPEETPESAAYLEISEKPSGDIALRLFDGWMFASSPALSSLEHPVYDIWVLDCISDTKLTQD